MTVQAAIAAELPGLRREAEARMTSTVTIYRQTGRTTQDESTGREVTVWDTVSTNVPFRLAAGGQSANGGQREVQVAGVDYSVATGTGNLPAVWTDLADNDHLHVTAGEWSGSAYRVIEATKGDQRTARRFPVVETDVRAEWV